MALEWAVDPGENGAYEFVVEAGPTAVGPGPDGTEGPEAPRVVDWAPALDALLTDLAAGSPPGAAAARFHNGLAAAVLEVAEAVGEPRVALTGGVFQNRVLTERTADALTGAGMRPLLHRRVPANDGGLSLGQVAVAAAQPGEAP